MRTNAEMASMSTASEAANNKTMASRTVTRQKTFRIELQARNEYVPHTANNSEPKQIRSSAPPAAITASAKLNLGLKE